MLDFIRRITLTQWIIVGVSTAGFINGSTAQLTEWFGAKAAHDIITGLGFAQGLIGCWVVALTSPGSQIQNVVANPNAQEAMLKAVLAMPGIEHVDVNARANATVATMAVDPSLSKIAPTPEARAEVSTTARNAA